jgi:hypothetical protein
MRGFWTGVTACFTLRGAAHFAAKRHSEEGLKYHPSCVPFFQLNSYFGYQVEIREWSV